MVMTQRGRPVAMLKSFDDDSHVETRVCQYEALKNEKGLYIAKQFVHAKMKGQNLLLGKNGFACLWSPMRKCTTYLSCSSMNFCHIFIKVIISSQRHKDVSTGAFMPDKLAIQFFQMTNHSVQ